jgi:hypothetical protein
MTELTLSENPKSYGVIRYNTNEKAREAQKKAAKAYYLKNREKVLAYQKQYKLAKLEKIKQSNGIYKNGMTWKECEKARIDKLFPIRKVIKVNDDFYV